MPQPEPTFTQNLRYMMTRGMRLTRNLLVDLRYGEYLGINFRLRDILRRPDEEHRLFYTFNSDIEALELVFKDRIGANDVLVDVGCGKGRVLNWWLHKGLRNRLVGLEMDAEIAEQTRRRFRNHPNIEIITGDAVANIPPDGTIFYVYNSFDPPVMTLFKDKLKVMFGEKKNITILYYSCKFVEVFEQDPAWNIQIEQVGSSSAAPFPPLAVITLR